MRESLLINHFNIMDIKNLYFKSRNQSIFSLDRSKLASREIETIEIFQDICNIDIIKSDGKVLDLGAGDKYLKPAFEKKQMNYTGLDIDDLDLEKDTINFADNHFDLVVSYSVIEHLYDPQNFLSETMRVMKPGAVVLIETPNWHYSYKTFYNDFTHVRPYCPASLKALLDANGFAEVNAFPNLRCKPKLFYKNKHAFKIAANIPFTGGASSFIPSILKGKSLGMFVIATKRNS